MKFVKNILVLCLFSGIVACGDSNKNAEPPDSEAFNWDTISSEFNPQIETIEDTLGNAKTISLNLFGFNDVRLRYSSDLIPGAYRLQLYTVNKDARTSLRGVNARTEDQTLYLGKRGYYECSYSTTNGTISSVKGACYVRVILTLPAGAEVEVYNLDQLISRRFFPMTNEAFLKALQDAWPSSKKTAVVETYLESYRNLRKAPSLSCNEMYKILGNFIYDGEKLEVLRLLHAYVSDREGLSELIDRNFSFGEKEKARRIVGLNP